MARLQHPNVVAVYDVGGHDDDQPFIAMEYVDGATLREWLSAPSRTGPEIIDAFLQAGRGLHAAHLAGVVHRDVKPDNILVGRDGRVRVADFGLAHRFEDMPGNTLRTSQSAHSSGFLGTPAYASPEQCRGEVADARSDQYSYCASLYEALYGCRPFAGPSIDALLLNIEAGSLVSNSDKRIRRLPKGARAIVVRGLAADPKARHQDVAAVVSALEAVLVQGQRRTQLATFAGVLAATAAAAITVAQRSPCEGQTSLDTYWSTSKRAAVQTALISVLGSAEEPEKIIGTIDAYLDRWSTAHRRACLARTASVEPELTQTRRIMCLAHRERAVRALVESLGRAKTERARRALSAAIDLPSPALCEDPRCFVALAPPPASALEATAVARLRDRLAAITANVVGGDAQNATPEALEAARKADEIGYLPVQAEVWEIVGRAQEQLGAYEEARTAFEKAYFMAVEADHSSTAVEVATRLVYLLSFHMSQNNSALEWGRHARASVERLGGGSLRGRLLMNLGTALEQEGRFQAAIAATSSAVSDLTAVHGPVHADIAVALTRQGSALASGGDSQEAVRRLRRALAMAEAVFGPTHQALHLPLAELGQALSVLDATEEAVEVQTRALDICRTSFGPLHVNTGFAELNLGVAYYYSNRMKEARAL